LFLLHLLLTATGRGRKSLEIIDPLRVWLKILISGVTCLRLGLVFYLNDVSLSHSFPPQTGCLGLYKQSKHLEFVIAVTDVSGDKSVPCTSGAMSYMLTPFFLLRGSR
jgi:hypothetical protein